jgi:hypothetical protein
MGVAADVQDLIVAVVLVLAIEKEDAAASVKDVDAASVKDVDAAF